MTLKQRIQAFDALGKRLQSMPEEEFLQLANNAKSQNAWFTHSTIKMALDGICVFLNKNELQKWTATYASILKENSSKTVALVMAGNIPLVGFHDFLSVLIAGHAALIKLSSKDAVLIRYLSNLLFEIEPEFKTKITFTEKLTAFDAVIATGSDNSSRYFDYYFAKYPNIIRKNRTSCAILDGNETADELQKLGQDVFSYFGLGCRNVSKIFVPINYDFSPLLKSWEIFKEIRNHHKYANNYDYQKSIMLVNAVPFLDNGFVMLTENEKTVSPISVVYYEKYTDAEDLQKKLEPLKDKLQCIVGKTKPATVLFGQAQYPNVWDYADQVDTMQFLGGLK